MFRERSGLQVNNLGAICIKMVFKTTAQSNFSVDKRIIMIIIIRIKGRGLRLFGTLHSNVQPSGRRTNKGG